jgi:hypothetical protein
MASGGGGPSTEDVETWHHHARSDHTHSHGTHRDLHQNAHETSAIILHPPGEWSSVLSRLSPAEPRRPGLQRRR